MTTGHCSLWLDVSTRTVRNRQKSVGLESRRVIKRPLLADRHRRSRLAWCLARRGCNLRTWRKIHWSYESRFLLHVTDGRMRVWRHKNTAYSTLQVYQRSYSQVGHIPPKMSDKFESQHSLSPTIWSDISDYLVGRESGYLKNFFTFLEVKMSNIL